MDSNKRIPKHVSIIMDGNGRWATARGMSRSQGHAEGVESIRACLQAAIESGVEYLSLYAFSEENWDRPKEEVGALMEMMAKAIREESEKLLKNKIRLLVLGNKARLSPALQKSISALEKATAKDYDRTLIIFLSYSGKWDISQAAVRMAQAGDTDIEKYLVTSGIPDPDLIIRTSGEQRISNYMLWQAAYSELYFTNTLWPDFREEEFDKALEEYSKRDRRYGKVK